MGRPKRVAQLRTLKVKTIIEVDEAGRPVRIISTETRLVDPILQWDVGEDEDPYPKEDTRASLSRAAIGYWSRLMKAVKKYGLDGDRDG